MSTKQVVVFIFVCCIVVISIGAFFWHEHNTPFSSMNLRREDLSHIYIACWSYAADHSGHFPTDWSAVLSYSNQATLHIFGKTGVKESIFMSPSRWADYRYLGGLSTDSAPSSVLVYTTVPHRTGFVLLAHGNILSLSSRDVKTLDEKARHLNENQPLELSSAYLSR